MKIKTEQSVRKHKLQIILMVSGMKDSLIKLKVSQLQQKQFQKNLGTT